MTTGLCRPGLAGITLSPESPLTKMIVSIIMTIILILPAIFSVMTVFVAYEEARCGD